MGQFHGRKLCVQAIRSFYCTSLKFRRFHEKFQLIRAGTRINCDINLYASFKKHVAAPDKSLKCERNAPKQ